jgi:cytochrome c peroxidase
MRARRATAAAACTDRAALGALAVLLGCSAGLGSQAARAGEAPFYSNSFDHVPTAAAMAEVGRDIFVDRSLSASGKMACATCHDPGHAFGPPNELAVQRGGADGTLPGVRSVPSLMYQQNLPPFTEHYFDSDEDDSVDQGPAGGRMWDGRAQSAHEQARLPLLSPFEMANAGEAQVAAKVRRAPYAQKLRAAFGDSVFADTARTFKAIVLSLETYQQTPADFYPYTSKYDAYLRGQASLSPAERRGLAVFNDPAKGNCARCHPSAIREGAFPQFTDFGYAAIGAPRNAAIAANADPRYFDLGLCGPLRADLAGRVEYCGLFRTPTLRNVSIKGVFLHNGVFHRLEDVVRFYAERDSAPEKWYSQGARGALAAYDDLPAAYRQNLDRQPPFGRGDGDPPALSNEEVGEVVAFLETLVDGYSATAARPRPVAFITGSHSEAKNDGQNFHNQCLGELNDQFESRDRLSARRCGRRKSVDESGQRRRNADRNPHQASGGDIQ